METHVVRPLMIVQVDGMERSVAFDEVPGFLREAPAEVDAWWNAFIRGDARAEMGVDVGAGIDDVRFRRFFRIRDPDGLPVQCNERGIATSAATFGIRPIPEGRTAGPWEAIRAPTEVCPPVSPFKSTLRDRTGDLVMATSGGKTFVRQGNAPSVSAVRPHGKTCRCPRDPSPG